MSSMDWPSVDANGVSLPSIVSSTDLFDGELFGDELIDIYNSSVVGENSGGTVNHEIPHLLPPENPSDPKKPEDEGTRIAITAATMDDGFGAFRPSTSFSDLTTLFSPSTEASSSTPTANGKKQTKKRSASASGSTAAPAAKRKATAPKATAVRRVSTGTKKQTVAGASAPVLRSSKKSDGTPDPLTMEQKTAQVVRSAVAPTKTVSTSVSVQAKVSAETSTAKAGGASNDNAASSEEAEFVSIAQTAVSNLIVNASAIGKTDPGTTEKVDTSTEHVKALTGNNWVAACSTAVPSVPVTTSSADKANNRARRQNLTPDERARQNRDRNREHARNTRLRKKAYVEELKRTLMELVSERDAAEFEKRQATQRELEQREVRFRVIEEFLKLRGRNETNFARWAAILEDGFSLTLPLTQLTKKVEPASTTAFDQVLQGVSDVMADSSCFAELLQTLGNDDEKGVVTFQYRCDRSNFFMDGCNAVLEWTATSVGAVKKGALSEISLKGNIRGEFSPASNKLLAASMTFDSGVILTQIHKHQAASDNGAELAAVQAAASQADAILDSLQMPRLATSLPTEVNVVHASSSSASEGSCEKGELDSDDSVAEGDRTGVCAGE